MRRLVLRRIALLPVTLLAVFAIVFVIAHLSPGGPWDSDLPVPNAVLMNLRAKFHADDPLPLRFLQLARDTFLLGDLGFSYQGSNPSVVSLIAETLPVSLTLAGAATLLALLVGLPVGAWAGMRQGRPGEHAVSAATLLGVSVPVYVSTPLLVVLLAVTAGWLPSGGWHGLLHPAAVIPVLALALSPAAHIARYTRASVQEVVQADHVLAAEAKGLRPGVLVARHILRNGLMPVVTVIGDDFARLATGTFFVESIYGIPGMGRLLVDAVAGRDYPVIIGVSLVIAALVATINLLVDLAYARLDPRVRYG